MNLSKPTWGCLAIVTAAIFFWLALRVDVYNATSPHALSHMVWGANTPTLHHPWWLSLHIGLRKFYSVVAFTIVGYTVHRSLPRARFAPLRAAAIVAAYSLAIEVAQHVIVPQEPLGERFFDIGCGALGGWLAVVLDDRRVHDSIALLRPEPYPERLDYLAGNQVSKRK